LSQRLERVSRTPFAPFTGLNATASVSSYGFKEGDWFMWNGFLPPDNRAAFQPNKSTRLSQFNDGTSNTLRAADVKVYQPLRRCSGGLMNVNSPTNIPSPDADPYTVAPEYGSAACGLGMSHTFWADGNPHETAMTTAWPPNKVILGRSGEGDLDLETRLYLQNGPTYGAITARSYHPGGVNALLAGGSVRFMKSSVTGVTRRALGTIAGGEVISADSC
jgi:prepilin-type processing-associated H-X9-DG protein